MENLLFLGVPILKHIRVFACWMANCRWFFFFDFVYKDKNSLFSYNGDMLSYKSLFVSRL